MIRLLKQLAALAFGFIELLLLFRFVLKLFGASTQSAFVVWIYTTSQAFLEPFLFAFPTPSVNGKFVLEFTTLFAIFAYAFIAYLVQEIFGLMAKNNR